MNKLINKIGKIVTISNTPNPKIRLRVFDNKPNMTWNAICFKQGEHANLLIHMDVIDLQSLDWSSLKVLYDKNLTLLQEKLLSGATWEETQYLRDLVTRLETAMDNTFPTATKQDETPFSARYKDS